MVCAGVSVHAGPDRGPGPRVGAAFRRPTQGVQLDGGHLESRHPSVAGNRDRDREAVAAGAAQTLQHRQRRRVRQRRDRRGVVAGMLERSLRRWRRRCGGGVLELADLAGGHAGRQACRLASVQEEGSRRRSGVVFDRSDARRARPATPDTAGDRRCPHPGEHPPRRAAYRQRPGAGVGDYGAAPWHPSGRECASTRAAPAATQGCAARLTDGC